MSELVALNLVDSDHLQYRVPVETKEEEILGWHQRRLAPIDDKADLLEQLQRHLQTGGALHLVTGP